MFTIVIIQMFTFVTMAKTIDKKEINFLYEMHREDSIFGRYVHNDFISKWLKKISDFRSLNGLQIEVEVLGRSVEKRDIISLTLGNGPTKLLMWSQMHGNESTTTKAVIDFVNLLLDSSAISSTILENCQIKVIPILNPDGAVAYTRLNANKVDLNRDAQDLSQPESKILRELFNDFKPHYCFNLHGQRSIFGAGHTGHPAVVSFLSPAVDESRAITETRKIAMELIAEMNAVLQNEIPHQVGVYDDSFNHNCVGDTFQSLNVPTILFEAGHINNDYEREITRYHIFKALLTAVNYISRNSVDGKNFEPYLEIPENQKCFFDIIIRKTKLGDIAIQYEERLADGILNFVPVVSKIGNLKEFYGHCEIDAKGLKGLKVDKSDIRINSEIDFVMINNEKFALKPKIN